MRKILLASAAFVGLSGVAHAAEAPLSITLGGYVDFRAAMFREATNSSTTTNSRRAGDFETEYRVNLSAEGKASSATSYGATVSLWNGAGYNSTNQRTVSGNGNQVLMDQAYVWVSTAYGKLVMGDEYGASSLFVTAPTVGEGQIGGTYTNFVDSETLMTMHPAFVDMDENNTKITYYTPKIGTKDHKVQLGLSYAPNFENQGQSAVLYSNGTLPIYQNAAEGVLAYQGKFGSVGATVAAMSSFAEGEKDRTPSTYHYRTATTWGLGTQLTYSDFTVGGSYVAAGRTGTYDNQDRPQDVWTAGMKYEKDKIGLALNGLHGRGYNPYTFAVGGSVSDRKNLNYVKVFNALGMGATYAWFPGLTSAVDFVMFKQDRTDIRFGEPVHENDGHVLMFAQKMTF